MATVSFSKFKKACTRAKKIVKFYIAPYRTGNLANNALKIEFPSKNVCYIYVDESVAPYMPYTTKPWISPRWHGKKNPNEGWWQRAGESVADAIADKVGGELKTAGGEKFTLQF
jgi:hypothetical protein